MGKCNTDPQLLSNSAVLGCLYLFLLGQSELFFFFLLSLDKMPFIVIEFDLYTTFLSATKNNVEIPPVLTPFIIMELYSKGSVKDDSVGEEIEISRGLIMHLSSLFLSIFIHSLTLEAISHNLGWPLTHCKLRTLNFWSCCPNARITGVCITPGVCSAEGWTEALVHAGPALNLASCAKLRHERWLHFCQSWWDKQPLLLGEKCGGRWG